MAYLPRYLIIDDDCCFHLTWQCHNKDWLLKWKWAKKLYYDLLLKYKDKYGVTIHSYNFMDNHPHIIGHLKTREEFSKFMQLVNSLFARKLNARRARRGQVVMDRPKSPMIESDKHMLTAMCYVDLNQCRAGKVEIPENNEWSSYSYYAHGKDDPLITPSPSYLLLGNAEEERQKTYRKMVYAVLASKQQINITHTYFIGNPDWVIEKYNELKDKLNKLNPDRSFPRATAPPY